MVDNSSANKRIAKNTLFLSIRMVIVLGVSLYTTRIVLQALGVEDYGVYNVVCGFVSLFSFLNVSMSNCIQRFYNYEFGKNGEEGANKVYCTSVIIQSVLALIVVVLIEIIGLWYIHNKMVIPEDRLNAAEWVFQLAIISFVIGVLTAPYSAAVTSHEKMDFYAIVSVLSVFLKLGGAFLLQLTSTDRLVLYGALLTVISLIDLCFFFFYCKHYFPEIHFNWRFEKDLFKKMFSFAGWNMFGSFSGVMENQGTNIVLNYFFGPVVNAARGVAMQVNGGVQSFVENITIPVRPQVIQSYASGNIQRTISLTYSVSKISSIIILMLSLPISLEIDFILHVWLGSEVPDHTASFTILIIACSFFNTLQSSLSGVVHATGKMKKYQLTCSFFRLMSLPISFVLLKIYGIPEICMLVVMLCATIVLVNSLFIVRQLVGISIRRYFLSVLMPVLGILAISLALLYPMHSYLAEGLLRLCIITVLSILLISGLSYIMVFDSNERDLLKQYAISITKKVKL